MTRRPQTQSFAILVLCLFLLSCGDSATGPDDEGGGGPEPQPDGVLLDGPASDDALSATRLLPPSPAAEQDIRDDGLLVTRLLAVIDPLATVGEVNAALSGVGARIVSMTPKNLFATLKIPPVTSVTEAEIVAAQLTSSGAFLLARAAYEATVPNPPASYLVKSGSAPGRVLPPSGKEGSIQHLLTGMASAWNASRAASGSPKVKVLVPDKYSLASSMPEIDALKMPIQGFLDASNDGQMNVGNHGFHVCGIIGADFDASPSTGSNPEPANRLIIEGISVRGLSWSDLFTYMSIQFPPTGKFVVNTSLGSSDGVLSQKEKFWLALDAMDWRIKSAPAAARFLHATAAGNEGEFPGDGGEARYGSPFNAARYFSDLRTIVDLDSLSSADSLAVEEAWANLIALHPTAAVASYNTIVVGSSDNLGGESAFSSRNSDVRMPGEEILAPCNQQDPGYPAIATLCNGTTAKYSGTSMATPLVAGLAAYLWSIEPSATLDDIIQAIEQSWSPTTGFVDAYAATLSMDQSLSEGVVRNTLLDVSGSTPTSAPNGVFDEHDIEAFLAKFQEYEDQRAVYGNEVDYSRYDLSGEGYTGGTFSNRFDLDVNVPPAFSSVQQTIEGQNKFYNENGVTDLDCLCYYAHSSLYDGDTTARADLLNEKCGVVPAVVYLGRAFDAGAATEVVVPDDDKITGDYVSMGYSGDTSPVSFTFEDQISLSGEGYTSYARVDASAELSFEWVDEQVVSVSFDYEFTGEVHVTSPPSALAPAPIRPEGGANGQGVYALAGAGAGENSWADFTASGPIDILVDYTKAGDCEQCQVTVVVGGTDSYTYTTSGVDIIPGVTGRIVVYFVTGNEITMVCGQTTCDPPSPQSQSANALLTVTFIGD